MSYLKIPRNRTTNTSQNSFAAVTFSSAAEQQDLELPHLPLPRYNADGSVQFLPRIVNGSAAHLGEFPGKVSIQNRQGAHFCGGTIVDTRHIVTAAHCVTNSRGQLENPTTVYLKHVLLMQSFNFYRILDANNG